MRNKKMEYSELFWEIWDGKMWDKDAKQAHLEYLAGSAGRGHFFYPDDKIADYPQNRCRW